MKFAAFRRRVKRNVRAYSAKKWNCAGPSRLEEGDERGHDGGKRSIVSRIQNSAPASPQLAADRRIRLSALRFRAIFVEGD
jgi:hypothetical protein